MSERLIKRFKVYLQKYNLLFMFTIVLIISIVMTKGLFMRPNNLIMLISRASVFGIIALGQAIVIISGGFDLSVGSLVAVAITVIASITVEGNLLLATIFGILIASGLGSINGLIIAKTRIPPFIVTLGMMSIARSVSWLVIAGKDIVLYEYKDLIQPLFSNIPMGANIFPIIIFIFCSLAIFLILHRSRLGRYFYSIGGNEKTAIASGVPVVRMKILVYTISGFFCSIAAIVYLYRICGASPAIGEEFLLQSIASATIGGVYMYGGEGNVGGVLIGIFILASITNVLNIAGFPPVIHKAVLGGIILIVVLLQRWLKKE